MKQDLENENIDILAAEYVLGTLSQDDRQWVADRAQQDDELQLAIDRWQAHFVGLNEYVTDERPRADLLADILAKIPAQPGSEVQAHGRDEVSLLRQQLSRWRRLTFASVAMAACLLVMLVINPFTSTSPESPFVAVFQADDQQPAFIMSLNLETRALTVRSVTAKNPQGKTYQLWIKSDEIGPNPRSLGVLGSVLEPVQRQVDFDANIIRHATFGISVEPKGGSPTGLPTGPAIHGWLYPTEI
ncbi:anti-sigma factor [Marinomonas sp. TW1]|uniref:anti-sigma factor n=1 Tax=Marinomonas sp. TW1 TaxID=1561203 RepID=UPI0007AFC643|nr:anti-sigma factor [Marinomonas sp. TW1]KZN13414.1 hypothetical protein OA79_10250 [Marinomonas sp. TW1]